MNKANNVAIVTDRDSIGPLREAWTRYAPEGAPLPRAQYRAVGDLLTVSKQICEGLPKKKRIKAHAVDAFIKSAGASGTQLCIIKYIEDTSGELDNLMRIRYYFRECWGKSFGYSQQPLLFVMLKEGSEGLTSEQSRKLHSLGFDISMYVKSPEELIARLCSSP